MVIGRAEGPLGDHPALGEDSKITSGNSRLGSGAGDDGEDRRVRVVVGDRVHSVEAVQIVLEGDIVTPPSDNVEDRMVHFGDMHFVQKFVVHFERNFLFGSLRGTSHRGEKVTGSSESVGTDGTEVREDEVTIDFADVTPWKKKVREK